MLKLKSLLNLNWVLIGGLTLSLALWVWVGWLLRAQIQGAVALALRVIPRDVVAAAGVLLVLLFVMFLVYPSRTQGRW